MIYTNFETEKDKIILVAGFPRSGTTWFSNLFNSHPDVVYRHEFIGRCYDKIPEKIFSSLKYDNGLTDSAYQELIDIIAAANANPAGVIIALDRQEKGTGELSAIQEVEKQYNIPVLSIVKLEHLITYIEDNPDFAQYLDKVKAYREQYGI